jgi:hypothetical protein
LSQFCPIFLPNLRCGRTSRTERIPDDPLPEREQSLREALFDGPNVAAARVARVRTQVANWDGCGCELSFDAATIGRARNPGKAQGAARGLRPGART